MSGLAVWISVQACAEYLKLPAKSIYRLIERGKLPAARVGKLIRINREMLDRQLLEQIKSGEQERAAK
jgi:excisionase family DNA binding protein